MTATFSRHSGLGEAPEERGSRAVVRTVEEVVSRILAVVLTIFELFAAAATLFGGMMTGDTQLVVGVLALIALSLTVTWVGIERTRRTVGRLFIIWPVLGGVIFLGVVLILNHS